MSPIVALTASIKLNTKAPVTLNPTSRPHTISPTSSPISDSTRCADRCFEPLTSSECPVNKAYVNCKFSYVGSVCYSEDDECGADPSIANCNGFAVYKRVNCNEVTIGSWAATATTSSSPTHLTGSGETCNYFPGWASGLSYCINDCDANAPKPVYMENNPIYEFPSLDLCCQAHFKRSERCKRASISAPGFESGVFVEEIGLASLDGEVWNDSNGDQWRDNSDGGVQNAIIDLYECDFNTWAKGTRTSLDGSFHLGKIPPGKYLLKITAPSGFHFIFDEHFWRNEDFDPSIATTPCYELRPFEDNSNFVVGLVPDSIVAPELVSMMDEPESLATYSNPHIKDASANQTPITAFAVHNKSSRGSASDQTSVPKPQPVAKEQVQVAPDITETKTAASENKSGALHTKSYVRGGNTETAHEVAVQATEAITISNLGNTDTQYLSVSDSEDILLKFDVSFLKGQHLLSAAVLRLYSVSSSPVGGTVYTASHSIWNANIVTWEDAPDIGDSIIEIGPTHPNQWVEVDITNGLATNRDDFISLRIHMGTSNSNWSAKYSQQKVQLQVTL
jgi:hypothetical protein